MLGERGHREIIGSRHAARDEGRGGRAGDERVQHVRARGLVAGVGEHAGPVDQRRPVGEELTVGLRYERVVKVLDCGGVAQRRGGLERVQAGVGEMADEPDLLHGHPVDLLDLPHERGDEVRAGKVDGELVDGDVGAALEHVDADDVAAHGADA